MHVDLSLPFEATFKSWLTWLLTDNYVLDDQLIDEYVDSFNIVITDWLTNLLDKFKEARQRA